MIIVVANLLGSLPVVFAQGTTKPTPASTAERIARANITCQVIGNEDDGYGYDVFVDGRRLIHQTNIPGMPGRTGFRKKEDSRRVAELVIKKLKNKELPPSVTEEELRRLKVID